jgi:hypothetical protein
MAKKKGDKKRAIQSIFEINVYIDDGRKFTYRVDTPEQVREHSYAIATTGYRNCTPTMLEHFPAHRISKIKCYGQGMSTDYPAVTSGT